MRCLGNPGKKSSNPGNTSSSENTLTHEPSYGDENENFDAVYEDTSETDIGNMQQHGSVLMHLLSQVWYTCKIGISLVAWHRC